MTSLNNFHLFTDLLNKNSSSYNVYNLRKWNIVNLTKKFWLVIFDLCLNSCIYASGETKLFGQFRFKLCLTKSWQWRKVYAKLQILLMFKSGFSQFLRFTPRFTGSPRFTFMTEVPFI